MQKPSSVVFEKSDDIGWSLKAELLASGTTATGIYCLEAQLYADYYALFLFSYYHDHQDCLVKYTLCEEGQLHSRWRKGQTWRDQVSF